MEVRRGNSPPGDGTPLFCVRADDLRPVRDRLSCRRPRPRAPGAVRRRVVRAFRCPTPTMSSNTPRGDYPWTRPRRRPPSVVRCLSVRQCPRRWRSNGTCPAVESRSSSLSLYNSLFVCISSSFSAIIRLRSAPTTQTLIAARKLATDMKRRWFDAGRDGPSSARARGSGADGRRTGGRNRTLRPGGAPTEAPGRAPTDRGGACPNAHGRP